MALRRNANKGRHSHGAFWRSRGGLPLSRWMAGREKVTPVTGASPYNRGAFQDWYIFSMYGETSVRPVSMASGATGIKYRSSILTIP